MNTRLFMSAFFVAVAIAAAGPPTSHRQYKVGGSAGWRVPDDSDTYANWAAAITFRAGDSLLFVYHNESVVTVDKGGYYHCNESGGGRGRVFTDGNTTFLLDHVDSYYFTSGDSEHCIRGQKLMVSAIDPHAPPAPPSTSGSTAVAAFGPAAAAAAAAWLLRSHHSPLVLP